MRTQQRNIVIISGGLLLVGGLVYIQIRKKNRTKKADSFFAEIQKRLDPSKSIVDDRFNVSTIKQSNVTLNSDEVQTIAKNIWNSWGVFNDDEEKVYSQLRLIQTVDDWKSVMKKYMILSDGVALDLDLRERLSEDEFKTANNIIKSYK